MALRNPPQLFRKKLLELGMQVQLRFVKDKAGVSRVRVQGNEQRDDFLEAVAFHRAQIVLNIPCAVDDHRNIGPARHSVAARHCVAACAAVRNLAGVRQRVAARNCVAARSLLLEHDGFSEHAGQHRLDFIPDFCIRLQDFERLGFRFPAVSFSAQEFNRPAVSGKLCGNGFRKQCFAGAVWPDNQVYVRPRVFLENCLAPQERELHIHCKMHHIIKYRS